jgi:hypothetical protein
MKESGGAVGDDAASSEALGWKTPNTMPGVRAAEKEKEARAWNTRNLGWRVGTDVVAAASAGVLVAPVITIIDR